MKIYRDYDRSELDAQYNLRAAFPDFPEHVKDWQERSAAVRSQLNWTLAVPYGMHPRMQLDVCRPAQPTGPVHVFFHGGYWQGMGREYFSFIAEHLAARGVVVVVPSYPLAPAASMGEIVDAARAAIVWTRRHAGDFGADCSQLSVAGHSAGGHLAALVSGFDGFARPSEGPPDMGCICISGIFDLEPIRLSYLNEALKLNEAEAAQHSPVKLNPPASVPLVLVVGGRETDEFHRQQRQYFDWCRELGHAASVLTVPDRHHFDIVSHVYSSATDTFSLIQHMIFRQA